MYGYRYVGVLSVLLLTGCTPSGSEDGAPAASGRRAPLDAYRENGAQQTIAVPLQSRSYIGVAAVAPQDAAAAVQAPARLEFRAKALSTVGAVVAGRLTKVNVQVGDRVKAGAVLATLESSAAAQMRADAARAKAELQRAEDRAKRQAAMQKSGVGLEIERVEADIQLRQAQADYQRSREALRLVGEDAGSAIVLRAARGGTVLRLGAAPGAAVEAGATLFELGDPGALWAVADVFDNDLPLIESGAKAMLYVGAVQQPLSGRVAAIGAAMQTDLRRGAVYIELDAAAPNLKPGMFARAAIETAGPRRIVLPTTAVLLKDKKRTMVYVETADGQFAARDVTVGVARDGQVPVLEGLQSGERVVTSGALLLDGAAAMLL